MKISYAQFHAHTNWGWVLALGEGLRMPQGEGLSMWILVPACSAV